MGHFNLAEKEGIEPSFPCGKQALQAYTNVETYIGLWIGDER
jgi:hypothetical protein